MNRLARQPAAPSATTRIEDWFAARDWQVFDFQREAWAAYANGESGLIHAPTGTGKTLAAWFGALDHWLTTTDDVDATPGLTVLWITPLRALAADTTAHLEASAAELGLNWTVERRTGDTKSHIKARQRKKLPSALVTTPESLCLLLSYAEHEKLFATLEVVVVDEWHELLSTKRGVQLELALARLRGLRPALRTWGLSATLANLDEAADALTGGATARSIRGLVPAETRIEALVPETIERFPWAGHLGTRLVEPVIAALEAAETTLLFTNTRSQAELWHQALLRARPDWLEYIALHHGSLDRDLRDRVEAMIADGRLRCVVATSSLDLGVDFSPVDQVIQIGSPKGVARLLQRAGRSGHRPGVASRILCVPTHAFELVEIAAARRKALAGEVEAREPLAGALDVLAQHIVTRALGSTRDGGVDQTSLLAEVRSSRAYRDLSDAEWRWTLDFVTRGGAALSAYPEFRRVEENDGRLRVTDRRIARRHRMTMGTITSDAAMSVQFVKGGRLGTVEERFIAQLKPGDVFLFSGRLLELARVRDLTAYVKTATRKNRQVPRWAGGRMAISGTLADAIRALLEAARDNDYREPELAAIRDLLEIQRRWSALPAAHELLVEHVTSREGRHWFFYPFAGRLAHEGLSALVAWRLARIHKASFRFSVNDYGFELVTRNKVDFSETELRAALSPDNLVEDLMACLNAAELSKRAFRDIARIAGLVFSGYPGAHKSARQVQASSGLVFDVLTRYDADNLLLDQARREVLERELEFNRVHAALERIAQQSLCVANPPRLTPLGFPLWVERVASQVSNESWRDRVERMTVQLEKAADKKPRKSTASERKWEGR
ncbi:ligase-associated DNA damage response DEXH box helicase [Endozoicomonas sp. G2_2]|uniref:ligase-associated DNA damage response DEXH box helicase n=1 Tax=Endozoicomonas sp. G2_2 TaxID=2821092 RepID=UPI001ADC7D30|nr:ligase-associated DNA damage response DEXH box helicase [Endozoicomonas sp. G2_2]MBO9469276.1 ligase-associated DNA damage response DEXH box helicase [Endozoicomonas sp. G2_2]